MGEPREDESKRTTDPGTAPRDEVRQTDEPVRQAAHDEQPASPVSAARRALLSFSGLLVALVAAWGGIVPYLGPRIGFGLNGQPAWRMSEANTVLHLVPGAVGVLCGLVILGAGPAFIRARFSAGFFGLVAMAAGAWFVVGPAAWPLLQSGANGGGAFVSGSVGVRGFVYQVGYQWGPGLLMVALAGIAVGLLYHGVPWAVRSGRVRMVREPRRRRIFG